MQRIALISHGKDSLAMLEAIHRLKLPLDRIVTVDIMATPCTRGELPEMVEFKERADAEILKRYGVKVEHLRAKKSFEEQFYSKKTKGKRTGEIYGFPMTTRAWCNDRLKMQPLNQFKPSEVLRYIGIAADEKERIERQAGKKDVVLPLVQVGWTEQMCYDWCKENNLLSPVYSDGFRDGCWFCPKQPIEQLRRIRKEHPDKWSKMLEWDKDSPVPFNANGYTLRDFDKRFAMEDKLLVPKSKAFRWSMLRQEEQRSEVG